MSEKLKPCPFCGSHFVAQGASRDRISVWCKCGAQGPEVPFPEIHPDPSVAIRECIRLWNRRADTCQARLSEAVKVLEKANVALNDWVALYASDECSAKSVEEAYGRVHKYGTLAYIADVTADIRAVLATLGEET